MTGDDTLIRASRTFLPEGEGSRLTRCRADTSAEIPLPPGEGGRRPGEGRVINARTRCLSRTPLIPLDLGLSTSGSIATAPDSIATTLDSIASTLCSIASTLDSIATTPELNRVDFGLDRDDPGTQSRR